jgi:integrase
VKENISNLIHKVFSALLSNTALALREAPFYWWMMVTLALTTGLRRGERLGLEWSHIDRKTGIIDVMQSVPKTGREHQA